MGMEFSNTLEFAQQLDANDPLNGYRNKFHIPEINGKEAIYFCGNSLGLQPKSTKDAVNQELEDWAKYGVESHFHAKNPWFSYHEIFAAPVARLVGALPSEVVVMNQLTVNLHLLMVSFFRPDEKRYKILCEAKAFPSDQYMLTSQVKFHGLDPEKVIVEVGPRDEEYAIRTADIIAKIEEAGNELALVMIGGVNYYTGQAFDMKAITAAGHKAGAVVGFDLAHATGNLKLDLHEWGVDFATWCGYKYLNSGPGSVSGIFIHERYNNSPELPRFAGWWGQDKSTRFLMQKDYVPMTGAEGWQLSNAPILSMAAHKASIAIFDEAGMDALCEKSNKLTSYLEFIIDEINRETETGKPKLEIITPRNKAERGCQISIIAHGRGWELHKKLTGQGIISDWREPNVIRIAPVPLYNSFEDVWTFGDILKKQLSQY